MARYAALFAIVIAAASTSIGRAQCCDEQSPVILTVHSSAAASPYAQSQTARNYPVSTAQYYETARPIAPLTPIAPQYVSNLRPIASTAPSLGGNCEPCICAPAPQTNLLAAPYYSAGDPAGGAYAANYGGVANYGVASGGYFHGRGIIGQPKLYVSGQPIRNFLRYLSP